MPPLYTYIFQGQMLATITIRAYTEEDALNVLRNTVANPNTFKRIN